LKTTPAVAAGVSFKAWTLADIVTLAEIQGDFGGLSDMLKKPVGSNQQALRATVLRTLPCWFQPKMTQSFDGQLSDSHHTYS
jgi:hypothetical protein